MRKPRLDSHLSGRIVNGTSAGFHGRLGTEPGAKGTGSAESISSSTIGRTIEKRLPLVSFIVGVRTQNDD